MQKVTDDTKLTQITTLLERMDDDHDGHLKVDDVLKVNIEMNSFFFLDQNLTKKTISFIADYRNDWTRRS